VEGEDPAAWVPLSAFLRAVGQAAAVGQVKRFLVNKKGVRWMRLDGGRPRVNVEYKHKRGGRGGGRGSGIIHGRLGWLRHVYWKHYCSL
jgi:hypothetical protein